MDGAAFQHQLAGIHPYYLFSAETFTQNAQGAIVIPGLRNGKNVGEMVFLLIEEDVFSKQPEDSLDDFKGFMSFRKAFEEPYEFQDQPS